MKTSKTTILALLLLLLTNLTFAQDKQPTMFTVHTDYVKFDKMMQYEEAAKEMKDNCVKHNVQGANWTAISIEDGRYVYVTPIENMADLDKNAMGDLFDKMDKDAANAMFDKMNECYDSHGNSIVHLNTSLSYMPEGAESNKDKNFREYHFLYYSPKNGKAMREAMEGVKKLFTDKGIKNGYSVYHSGFGSDEGYYMISIAAKDDLEIAQNGKINDAAFGDEGQATFYKVISLTNRYDKVEGRIRPDLSYLSAQE
jgi:hypothetical protein